VQKEGSPKWYAVLFAWRFLDMLLWVWMIGWTVFCTIIIMVFLASTTPLDGRHWLATAIMSLLQWLVVNPFAFAALLALSYEWFIRMTPDYEEIVKGFLGIKDGNTGQERAAEMEPETGSTFENKTSQQPKLTLAAEVFGSAQKGMIQIEQADGDDEETVGGTRLNFCSVDNRASPVLRDDSNSLFAMDFIDDERPEAPACRALVTNQHYGGQRQKALGPTVFEVEQDKFELCRDIELCVLSRPPAGGFH